MSIENVLLILKEVERHGTVVGPYFNLRCKCGYVGTNVSQKGDFEFHLATSLVDAGFGLVYAEEKE